MGKKLRIIGGLMILLFAVGCTNSEMKSVNVESVLVSSTIDTLKQNKVEPNPKEYFPKMDGFTFNRRYSEIVMTCPKLDASKSYFDIAFVIENSIILNKIGLIQVNHFKNSVKEEDKNYFEIFFHPELGINRIRLKNIKEKGSYTLRFGVHFKESRDAKYPHLHGIECIVEKE